MKPTPEQIQYVRNELARGVPETALKSALAEAGYSGELITQIWAEASAVPSPSEAPHLSEEPKSRSIIGKIIFIMLIVVGGLLLLVGLITVIGIFSVGKEVNNSLDEARSMGQDAFVKSELNKFRVDAEFYFDGNNRSYAGACGQLELSMGRMSSCVDSTTAFRASAQLNTGMYYCIDSLGAVVELEQEPAGTSCQ